MNGAHKISKNKVFFILILSRRIPWTEKPGGLQSMGLQRVGHDWVTQKQQQSGIKKKKGKRKREKGLYPLLLKFSSVHLLSCVRLLATLWTAACQASLSITNSQRLVKLMSIVSAMPSNHLILCCTLFLLPSIFPSVRVFSSELVLCIRWPKYLSFSFSISPSNEYSGLILLGGTGWISLQSKDS